MPDAPSPDTTPRAAARELLSPPGGLLLWIVVALELLAFSLIFLLIAPRSHLRDEHRVHELERTLAARRDLLDHVHRPHPALGQGPHDAELPGEQGSTRAARA